MDFIPHDWRSDLSAAFFERLGMPAPKAALPLDGTFVVERIGITLETDERFIVERARPGLMRHPFHQRAAAEALVKTIREVPLASTRQVDPPFSSRPLLLREIYPGRTVEALDDVDSCAALADAIGRLHRVRAVAVGVHAEDGRFVAATNWAEAVRAEIRLAQRTMATHGLDVGTLEDTLFAWLDGLLDGLVEPLDPCLVHGNLTDAHLRYEDGALVEITGWEHAALGDPLADVGAQLHLGGEAARTVVEGLDSDALSEPGLEDRLAVGYHLATVRTLATMSASIPAMGAEQRAGWVERMRVLVERGLSRDPADIFHGRPVPPVPEPDPDRAILHHLAEVLGSVPHLGSGHAVPMAAVLAMLELGAGELRGLALDRIRGVMQVFQGRTPMRIRFDGPSDALERIDALRPDGRVRAFCAAHVVRTLESRLGEALPEPARAGADMWLTTLRNVLDTPKGSVAELADAAILGWLRPAMKDELHSRVETLLTDFPDPPELERSAAFSALAAAPVAFHAPLVVAGMQALGFDEPACKRALVGAVPNLDWSR